MKRFFLNNYKIKILSVFLATGLWWFVYVSQNTRTSTSFPVTIRYENLAPEFRLESPVKTVRVELRGDSRRLETVGPENLQSAADLAGLGKGQHRVAVNIINNTGLQIQNRVGDIEVQLTPLKKIELPVELKVNGALKPGYSFGEVTYKPMSAAVYGDDNDLKQVEKIIASIDVSGRKKSYRAQAALHALDGAGNSVEDVHFSPAAATVYVTVQGGEGKTAQVAVRFKDPDLRKDYPNADFSPREVSITGDPEILKNIKTVETEEFDLSQCGAGGVYQLKIKLPENVTANASQVAFSCEPSKNSSRVLTVPLHAINLCDSCNAGLKPEEIKVTVTGFPDAVNALEPTGVSASVDLLNLKAGAHEVAPHVQLEKENNQIKLDYPASPVKVVIKK